MPSLIYCLLLCVVLMGSSSDETLLWCYNHRLTIAFLITTFFKLSRLYLTSSKAKKDRENLHDKAITFAKDLINVSNHVGHGTEDVLTVFLYGRVKIRSSDDERVSSKSAVHCFIEDKSGETLEQFLNIVKSTKEFELIRCRRFGIVLEEFYFVEIPSNIGDVFPFSSGLHLIDCLHLKSLEGVVTQLEYLEFLYCRCCLSLESLSSLALISPKSPLRSLKFGHCPLNPIHKSDEDLDDWDESFRAIARTSRNSKRKRFTLAFDSCCNLECLPPSIQHLKDMDTDEIIIDLVACYVLNRIPYEIGQIENLVHLSLIAIPELPWYRPIPWTLARVREDCTLQVGYNTTRISDLRPKYHQKATKFYIGLFKLSVLLVRARLRAAKKVYAPGGSGYERAKHHFYSSVHAATSDLLIS